MKRAREIVAALALAAGTICPTKAVMAAESATSVYLLGSKGAMAGFTPPPGTYLADANYFYAGEASGAAALGVTLRRTGAADAGGIRLDVKADVTIEGMAYYNIPTATWVAPAKVLGGNPGVSLMLPIGWKSVDVDIEATASLTLPPPLSLTLLRSQRLSLDDQRTDFGDPLVTTFLGWHEGPLHWNLNFMTNVPLGQWDEEKLANIGFNHWAFDLMAAATWLDLGTGFELSGAAGFTFNTENPDTDYKSGTDFHAEFAAMQHVSKTFAIGVTGYHYRQISGDSGAGAVLGDFKGRVTGIGPAVTYDFALGQLPVMTSLKWTHEFEAENRLEGDMGFLTVTIPLGPPPAAP